MLSFRTCEDIDALRFAMTHRVSGRLQPTRRPDEGPWAVVRSPEDLGAFLARLRSAHGLTQEELAAELGISRRYVYEIESGKPNLYARRLFEIINLLDATVTVAYRTPADASAGSGSDGATP
jgi:HTH-type transcriptional regulator/antitoxin HipB